jgi:hypothetical protein
MPGRKRKERYINLSSILFDAESISLEAMDEELVILPSQDSTDAPLENCIMADVHQWDSVVHTINKVTSTLCQLKGLVGKNIESLDNLVLFVEAKLGTVPPGMGLDDCASVWDHMIILPNQIVELTQTLSQPKELVAKVEEMLSPGLAEARRNLTTQVETNLNEVKTNLSHVMEYVKILGLEQEKLSKMLLNGQQNAPLTLMANKQLRDQLKELKREIRGSHLSSW